MAKMKDIYIQISELVEKGDLTDQQIALFLEVPLSWVESVAKDLSKEYERLA